MPLWQTSTQTARLASVPRATETRGLVMLAGLGLLLALVTGLFACRRSIFQDEGAIILNFAAGLSGFFAPLPFYDQAAPPLAMALLSALYHFAGGDIFVLRMFQLLIFLVGLGVAMAAAIRARNAGLLYGLLILLAVRPVLLNATEIKQYSYEVLFSVGLITMHLACRRGYGPAHLAAFLGVALLSLLFTFSSLFIVCAVMFDIVICREARGRRRLWAAGGMVFLACWAGTYLLLIKPLTALQFINYGAAYEGLTLRNVLLHRDLTSLGIMLREVRGIGPHLFLIVAVPVLAFALLRTRGRWVARLLPPRAEALSGEYAPVRLLIFVCGGLGALNLVGAYPFTTTRQLLYVAPVICIFLGWLTVRLVRAVTDRPRLRVALLTLMIVPALAYNLAVAAATSYVKTDVADLYAYIKAHHYKHVVSWVIFDPTLHVFLRDDPSHDFEVAGLLNPASGPVISTDALKARLNADADDIPNQLWSILKTEDDFRPYIDWVVRRVRRHDVTLIATVEIFPFQEQQLMAALAAAGCSAKAVFEEKAVKAFEARCPAVRNG